MKKDKLRILEKMYDNCETGGIKYIKSANGLCADLLAG